MHKLLSLKEWLTLDEGATYLRGVFNEPVSVADLYHFCLSGRLTLSANFVNHGRARFGQMKLIREAGFDLSPGQEEDEEGVSLYLTDEAMPEFEAWVQANPEASAFLEADEPKSKSARLKGEQVSATDCLCLEPVISIISGVWDLSMIGAERLDVQHSLQREVGGPQVRLDCFGGVLLHHPEGRYASLQIRLDEILPVKSERPSPIRKIPQSAKSECQRYCPAGGLPKDAPIVVRPAALMEFSTEVSGTPRSGKELSTRERNNLLRIIAGLAKECCIDLAPGGKGASQIDAAIVLSGFDGPKEKTIRDVLAQVRTLDSVR